MPHSVAAKNGKAVVGLGSELLLVENGAVAKKITVDQSVAPKGSANFVDALTVTPDNHWIGIDHYGKQLVLYSEDLDVISARVFPKRPSAFAVVNGSALVGDKFGDVYQVPLTSTEPVCDDKGQAKIEPVLGHVSMLLNVEVYDSKWIITSDRDEHIRLSSLAHPYVIERFLFGHEQYVCKLLLVGKLLVSGGGDDFICSWDLETGEQIARLSLRPFYKDLEEFDVSVLVEYQGDILLVVEGTQKILRVSTPNLELVGEYDVPEKITAIAVDDQDIYVASTNKLAVTSTLPPQFKEIELPETKEVPLLIQGQLRKRPEY